LLHLIACFQIILGLEIDLFLVPCISHVYPQARGDGTILVPHHHFLSNSSFPNSTEDRERVFAENKMPPHSAEETTPLLKQNSSDLQKDLDSRLSKWTSKAKGKNKKSKGKGKGKGKGKEEPKILISVFEGSSQVQGRQEQPNSVSGGK